MEERSDEIISLVKSSLLQLSWTLGTPRSRKVLPSRRRNTTNYQQNPLKSARKLWHIASNKLHVWELTAVSLARFGTPKLRHKTQTSQVTQGQARFGTLKLRHNKDQTTQVTQAQARTTVQFLLPTCRWKNVSNGRTFQMEAHIKWSPIVNVSSPAVCETSFWAVIVFQNRQRRDFEFPCSAL